MKHSHSCTFTSKILYIYSSSFIKVSKRTDKNKETSKLKDVSS